MPKYMILEPCKSCGNHKRGTRHQADQHHYCALTGRDLSEYDQDDDCVNVKENTDGN